MIKNKFTKLSSILAKASAVAIIASSTSALAMTDVDFAQLNAEYTNTIRPQILGSQFGAFVPTLDQFFQVIQATGEYQDPEFDNFVEYLFNELQEEDVPEVIVGMMGYIYENGTDSQIQQFDTVIASAENQNSQLTSQISAAIQAQVTVVTEGPSSISNATNALTQAQASMVTNQLNSSLIQLKSGTSSGNENIYNGGVWIKGFGQQATQKATKKLSGYKLNSFGGIVGVDSLLSDNFTLGAAVGYASTDIKLKTLAKTKFDVKTWILSLYGAYEFNESLYTKGSLTYALSNIKSNLGYNLARKSKSNNTAFIADVALGYKVAVADNVILAPEVGFRASTFKDGKVTIKNSNNRNILEIKSRNGNNFQGILGARLSADLGSESASFTPSVHAKVIQQLGGKYPKIQGTFSGFDFSTKMAKPQKTMFVAGADVSISNGPVDIELGYDATMAKKYLSHTGSLKLRVNF